MRIFVHFLRQVGSDGDAGQIKGTHGIADLLKQGKVIWVRGITTKKDIEYLLVIIIMVVFVFKLILVRWL